MIKCLVVITALNMVLSGVTSQYEGYNYYQYSVIDATNVQKVVAGLSTSNDYLNKLYDANNDGTLSVVDATLIQKDVVGQVPISNDIDTFNNGSDIAKVAYSYYDSEEYLYKEGSILNDNNLVRDENGTSYMDNLTFVLLSATGSDYSNSLYAKHKGSNATWNPKTEIFEYNVFNSPFSSLAYSLMLKYDYYDEKEVTTDVVNYLDTKSEIVYNVENGMDISKIRPGDIVNTSNGLGIISEMADGYFIFDENTSKITFNTVGNEVSKVYRVNYNSLYS
mgnify:CR=1 FL=1|jgi:hypothetical protein